MVIGNLAMLHRRGSSPNEVRSTGTEVVDRVLVGRCCGGVEEGDTGDRRQWGFQPRVPRREQWCTPWEANMGTTHGIPGTGRWSDFGGYDDTVYMDR